MDHLVRNILDQIFGMKNFRNEIVWNSGDTSGYKSGAKNWIREHDIILYYSKSDTRMFNKQTQSHDPEYLKNRFKKVDSDGRKFFKGTNKIYYLDEVVEKGIPVGNVWDDINSFQTAARSKERLGYPTQKPEKLIERIIKASS